jgi:hypothetical protein
MVTDQKREKHQMSKAPIPLHGVMEGAGAYNRYAKLPASGADLAVPLLQEADGCQCDGYSHDH